MKWEFVGNEVIEVTGPEGSFELHQINVRVFRRRITTGWIVATIGRHGEGMGSSMVFVQDPEHSWDLAAEREEYAKAKAA